MNTESTQPQIEPLPGTVKLYQRHLFVCTGQSGWPARIETGGGFLQALAEAVQARAAEIPFKVKITACDEAGAAGGHDILLFPEAVRYVGLQEADLPLLVDRHLVGNEVTDRLPHQQLSGQHLFVCVHQERDPLCGACGPPLIEQFKAILTDRGLADRVAIRGTSHVGGHRFAGNVLIYPGGDWYGRVTPADVGRIVDEHLIDGRIVTNLWRGRMGLSPEAQVQAVQSTMTETP